MRSVVILRYTDVMSRMETKQNNSALREDFRSARESGQSDQFSLHALSGYLRICVFFTGTATAKTGQTGRMPG